MGLEVPTETPPGVRRMRGWLVDANHMHHWASRLRAAVERHLGQDPLSPGLSEGAAADHLGLPDRALLPPLISQAGLLHGDGRITSPRSRRGLGAAEASVVDLEKQLATAPFSAPEAQRLAELRLTERELAAAERQGRLLRLAEGVVILPSAPAQAMRVLSRLDQPFTMSAARQALGTSRRVAVPLLEHLDSRGWTRRVDAALREVVR